VARARSRARGGRRASASRHVRGPAANLRARDEQHSAATAGSKRAAQSAGEACGLRRRSRDGAVRCGAVRCGAVRCGAVRCGAVWRCAFGWDCKGPPARGRRATQEPQERPTGATRITASPPSRAGGGLRDGQETVTYHSQKSNEHGGEPIRGRTNTGSNQYGGEPIRTSRIPVGPDAVTRRPRVLDRFRGRRLRTA